MRLPRQAASVTAARHTLVHALAGIGVDQQCRDDIALALSEACSNAVEHARVGQGYDVVVTVGRTRCIVDVVDSGVGMDLRRPDGPPETATATRGRGLHLIRAVTDGLHMRRVDPHGLALCMIKTLSWVRDAPRRGDVGQDPWAIVHPENRLDDVLVPGPLLEAGGFLTNVAEP
jgi:serine/threonine-protein kinase RsbW